VIEGVSECQSMYYTVWDDSRARGKSRLRSAACTDAVKIGWWCIGNRMRPDCQPNTPQGLRKTTHASSGTRYESTSRQCPDIGYERANTIESTTVFSIAKHYTYPSSRSPKIIPSSNRTLNFPCPWFINAYSRYVDPIIVRLVMIVWPTPLMNNRRGLVEAGDTGCDISSREPMTGCKPASPMRTASPVV